MKLEDEIKEKIPNIQISRWGEKNHVHVYVYDDIKESFCIGIIPCGDMYKLIFIHTYRQDDDWQYRTLLDLPSLIDVLKETISYCRLVSPNFLWNTWEDNAFLKLNWNHGSHY